MNTMNENVDYLIKKTTKKLRKQKDRIENLERYNAELIDVLRELRQSCEAAKGRCFLFQYIADFLAVTSMKINL